jgi:hypothetical protein
VEVEVGIMKEIYDPQYYDTLCSRYGIKIAQETGKRVVLDRSFYQGFRKWVKKEYNIDNNGSIVLTFKDDRDYIMFLLRWGSWI